jgi:hypothetical protein
MVPTAKRPKREEVPCHQGGENEAGRVPAPARAKVEADDDAGTQHSAKLKKLDPARVGSAVAVKEKQRQREVDLALQPRRGGLEFDADDLSFDEHRRRVRAQPYLPRQHHQALPLPRPEAPIYSLRHGLTMMLIGLVSVVIIFFLGPWNGASELGSYFQRFTGSDVQNNFQAQLIANAPGDYTLKAPPSISAQQIDVILESYASPATGTGPIWYRLGREYGIDPAFAVAFFIMESSAGTNPRWDGMKVYDASNPRNSVTTHNIGNISCAGYPTCMGRWRDYPDWETGIRDWYRLIDVEYIQGRGHKTVADVLPVYAPSFENDTNGYVNTVNGIVDRWRTPGWRP